MAFVINLVISAFVISTAAWLSNRHPTLAGFIVALPLASMIVLPLAYVQHADPGSAFHLARSIFIAIPVSLTFFLPFLFSGPLGLSFWQAYALGCLALPVGFVVHRFVTSAILP